MKTTRGKTNLGCELVVAPLGLFVALGSAADHRSYPLVLGLVNPISVANSELEHWNCCLPLLRRLGPERFLLDGAESGEGQAKRIVDATHFPPL